MNFHDYLTPICDLYTAWHPALHIVPGYGLRAALGALLMAGGAIGLCVTCHNGLKAACDAHFIQQRD